MEFSFQSSFVDSFFSLFISYSIRFLETWVNFVVRPKSLKFAMDCSRNSDFYNKVLILSLSWIKILDIYLIANMKIYIFVILFFNKQEKKFNLFFKLTYQNNMLVMLWFFALFLAQIVLQFWEVAE